MVPGAHPQKNRFWVLIFSIRLPVGHAADFVLSSSRMLSSVLLFLSASIHKLVSRPIGLDGLSPGFRSRLAGGFSHSGPRGRLVPPQMYAGSDKACGLRLSSNSDKHVTTKCSYMKFLKHEETKPRSNQRISGNTVLSPAR